MSNNSTKILFLMTMISGILIVISSNSWLSAWMGLEINLLSFIPIMSSHDNIYTSESSLKYFIIQALASTTLLFLVLLSMTTEMLNPLYTSTLTSSAILTPLLLKTGAAPLHWWFPSVMEGLSWQNCIILMTIQKLSPMTLISYLWTTSTFSIIIIITSITIGSISGLNQTSIRKIMTYSSINHMGWMLTAMLLGDNYWLMYLLIYSMMTLTVIMVIYPSQISFINQTFLLDNKNPIMKFLLFTSLLSLGGLPPFTGFFPKWVIIQNTLDNKMIILITMMVMMSLITLYYYLQLSYSAFLMNYSNPSWNIQKMYKNTSAILFTTTTMGLILSTTISYIY
uniref:NADH dehydrogenase subunit 2 n=1 Tax=Sigmella ectobioides TaxID=1670702 RepID=UPI00279DF0E0|nr:NADH dehydrogenase subunit 2 [Sigmella ectobioides]WGO57704.1 NADH dehydrogenase subunit 2 [Sigmella ectobioides]